MTVLTLLLLSLLLSLHSVGDSTIVEEFIVEPLHSAIDPAAAKPLQSIADSNAVADALTETTCS
jgi:hypothetical protein